MPTAAPSGAGRRGRDLGVRGSPASRPVRDSSPIVRGRPCCSGRPGTSPELRRSRTAACRRLPLRCLPVNDVRRKRCRPTPLPPRAGGTTAAAADESCEIAVVPGTTGVLRLPRELRRGRQVAEPRRTTVAHDQLRPRRQLRRPDRATVRVAERLQRVHGSDSDVGARDSRGNDQYVGPDGHGLGHQGLDRLAVAADCRTRPGTLDGVSALDRFSAATRAWFTGAFAQPTPAQAGAWEAISSGEHALVVAPTGSGKTLAAFLWSLDRLAAAPPPADDRSSAAGCSTSRRSRRWPSTSSATCAPRWPASGRPPPGSACPRPRSRSASAPATPRPTSAGRSPAGPPDILITTPESLFLLLTSPRRGRRCAASRR